MLSHLICFAFTAVSLLSVLTQFFQSSMKKKSDEDVLGCATLLLQKDHLLKYFFKCKGHTKSLECFQSTYSNLKEQAHSPSIDKNFKEIDLSSQSKEQQDMPLYIYINT